MSRIYFHSEHDEAAELRGSERAYAGRICSDLLVQALGANSLSLWEEDEAALRHLLPAGHSGHTTTGAMFQRLIQTWLAVGDGDFATHPGVTPFSAGLNTALVMGSDPVRLLARLHGQCEIHVYVEGPHRAWLADIITAGRATGVLRAGQGWEDIVTLLRSRNDGPVVTSYSVCDGFPNAGVANWQAEAVEEDEDNDAWYALSVQERWRLAMEGLRAQPLMALDPENWATYHVHSGVNGFQIIAAAREAVAKLANSGAGS